MKKRILSLMLVLMMVFSCFPAVYADNTLVLSVSADKTTVAAGEKITFTVSADNAEQFKKLMFRFDYDSSLLEYNENTGYEFLIDKDFGNVIKKTDENYLGVTVSLGSPFEQKSADIVKLTFTAKSTANGGKPDCGIKNVEYGSGDEASVSGDSDNSGLPEITVSGTQKSYFTAETDKQTAKPDDIVTVSLKSNIASFRGMQFDLDYPEDSLEYISANFSDAIRNQDSSAVYNVGTKRAFLTGSVTNVTGTVFTAQFKVKDSASDNVAVTFKNVKTQIDSENLNLGNISAPEISVSESGSRIILSSDRTAVAPGSAVNVYISGKSLDNFKGMEFILNYDPEVFEIGTAEKLLSGAAVNDLEKQSDGKYKFTVAKDINGDCDFYKIPFTAKKAVGETEISITELKVSAETTKAPEILKINVNNGAFDAVLTVSKSAESVALGDEVTYYFDMNGFARSIQFEAEYDDEVLELIGFEEGILKTADRSATNDTEVIKLFDINNAVAVNGRLFGLKFKVKDSAKVGYTDVTVKNLRSGDSFNVVHSGKLELFDGDVMANISAKADKKFVAKNEKVTFNVNLDANHAFAGMQMLFEYDATKLKFDSYSYADADNLQVGTCSDENGKVEIVFSYADPKLIKDDFVSLTFTVNDTAEKGKTEYKITQPKIIGSSKQINIVSPEPIRIVNRFSTYEFSIISPILEQNTEYDVDVMLKNADDAEGVNFALNYNTELFDYVGFEKNADLSADGDFNKENNKLLYTFESVHNDDILKIGTLKLKTKNEGGNTEIKFENTKLPVQNGSDKHIAAPFDIKNLTLYVKTNQDYADAVMEKINSIGDVTLNSSELISAAEKAYSELRDDQKALVNNYDVLTEARAKFDKLVADRAAADAVIAKINEIGEVTLESGTAVADAEKAYANLTEDQKALIDNYGTLTAARAKFDKLVADRAAADAVIAKINAIGDVTLESGTAVADAESAYASLTDDQKALIDNYGTLTAARTKYDKLVADRAAADAVIAKINEIGEVTLENEDKIIAAENAYADLTDEQKALVSNYEALTGARSAFIKLVEDKAAVDNVIALIDAIGTPDINSAETITKAQEAFDALSEELKVRVTNKEALDNAQAVYAEQKQAVDNVISLINAIAEPVTIDYKDAIIAAETAYEALSDAQKAHITNYETLKLRREAFDKIRTVRFDSNGGTAVENQYVNEGEKATAPTVSRSGLVLVGWYTEPSHINKWNFETDAVVKDITLYAYWTSTSGGGGGGGSSSKKNNSVVITTPSEPTKDDENTKNDNENSEVFTDLSGHWAQDVIEKLYNGGIVNGTSENTFEPDKNVTRAEFAMMISCLLKLNETAEKVFDDVNADDWFGSAVAAVSKAGIVSGFDGKFRPNDNISRQEMAVMVSKTYDYMFLPQPELKGLDMFSDKDEIAEWAAPHVERLTSAEIINGYDDGTFKPLVNTTRAHAAIVINKLMSVK